MNLPGPARKKSRCAAGVRILFLQYNWNSQNARCNSCRRTGISPGQNRRLHRAFVQVGQKPAYGKCKERQRTQIRDRGRQRSAAAQSAETGNRQKSVIISQCGELTGLDASLAPNKPGLCTGHNIAQRFGNIARRMKVTRRSSTRKDNLYVIALAPMPQCAPGGPRIVRHVCGTPAGTRIWLSFAEPSRATAMRMPAAANIVIRLLRP